MWPRVSACTLPPFSIHIVESWAYLRVSLQQALCTHPAFSVASLGIHFVSGRYGFDFLVKIKLFFEGRIGWGTKCDHMVAGENS